MSVLQFDHKSRVWLLTLSVRSCTTLTTGGKDFVKCPLMVVIIVFSSRSEAPNLAPLFSTLSTGLYVYTVGVQNQLCGSHHIRHNHFLFLTLYQQRFLCSTIKLYVILAKCSI